MKKLAIYCVVLAVAVTAVFGAGFYMSLDSSGDSVVYSDYFSGDGSLLTGLTATSMPEIALLTTTQAALTVRATAAITTNAAQTTAIGNLTTTQSTLRAEGTAAITTNTAQTTAIGNLSTTSGTHTASIGVLETGVVYLTTSDYTTAIDQAGELYTGAVWLTTADYTDAVAKADSAAQEASIPASVSFASPVVDATTGTVIFTVKDLNGDSYTDHVLVRLYLCASPYDGTPVTTGVDTATVTAGSAVETVTANCHWQALTQTGGAGQVTIVATSAAFTNYLVGISPNGTMTYTAVGFE